MPRSGGRAWTSPRAAGRRRSAGCTASAPTASPARAARTHAWAGAAISAFDRGLPPTARTAMRFARIACRGCKGEVLDLDTQEALVRDLGDRGATIPRRHGLPTVGRAAAEASNALHRLEPPCGTRIAAMSCWAKLREAPRTVVDATCANHRPRVRRPFGVMEWPAMLRRLDRLDPFWRDWDPLGPSR